jgi:hypothetical protein
VIPGRCEPSARVDVVPYRCDRLIDLVDEGGHDLAKVRQALDVSQFGLQFLNAPLTRVAVDLVAQDFDAPIILRPAFRMGEMVVETLI